MQLSYVAIVQGGPLGDFGETIVTDLSADYRTARIELAAQVVAEWGEDVSVVALYLNDGSF